MASISLATEEDAADLAPRLRKEDLAEIEAASGKDGLHALREGLRNSAPCQVLVHKGRAVAMGGVAPVAQGAGAVWLLGSDDIKSIQITFLRMSRPWISRMHERYDLLFNAVDSRNLVHIKWLRWCGFTFIKTHSEYGHARLPFHEFVRLKPCASPPPSP